MKKFLLPAMAFALLISCNGNEDIDRKNHDLYFSTLATKWDEAIPLGNGMNGALIWQKEGRLRISLDRADLWDLRPMENIGIPEWTYKWVYNQWKNNTYSEVQKKFDAPYDQLAAPTKIPAAAIEFDVSGLGEVRDIHLDIESAICRILWSGGAELEVFIEAEGEHGWYKFTGAGIPETNLLPPPYTKHVTLQPSDIQTSDLARLGYDDGIINREPNRIEYFQKGWKSFTYSVDIEWINNNNVTTGNWNISVPGKIIDKKGNNSEPVTRISGAEYSDARDRHLSWWKRFWDSSSICLPDSLLEKQWYLEMYKFGSAARANTPPVSLQAVWTADNGLLPPWKGDFHHDLNTQLSYWPAYSSNHTDLAAGFTSWLWNNRETFKKYTSGFYCNDGLNVPGVTSLDGQPLGGWIQYSFGPTVSAWLAHHFYLQWKYTGDTVFLVERAYPWISDVAEHLESISVFGENGMRQFPISSSPEFNDNNREAWFPVITNFDLALTRWTLKTAAELASIVGEIEEQKHWEGLLSQWPELSADSETGLMIAPDYPYAESHRHFSHLMAIYPLGLIDVSSSAEEKELIMKSLQNLEKNGADYWTGYSYAWQGCLYARALNGNRAAEALTVFATCFCLPNSFHVNGDQSGTGRSKFTYRPFTLEGNFAFAAGIQEMLLQSHRGMIEVFPAIPEGWSDLSFKNLKAMDAVLVSAVMKEGVVSQIQLMSEKGGLIRLKNPFNDDGFRSSVKYDISGEIISINTKAGDAILLRRK